MRGTSTRPRLTVFRSARHIYAQVVNDDERRTLTAVCSLTKDIGATNADGGKLKVAAVVGAAIAARCVEKGIAQVVFDRNGYPYHGRVKALAEAARGGGLSF